MTAVTICSDDGAPENKVCHCFHCFPIYLPWSDGTDAMILVFWMLSFKPTFSLSSFTFTKRLFSSSSLSAIRVVSSAYLVIHDGLKNEGNITTLLYIYFWASLEKRTVSAKGCPGSKASLNGECGWGRRSTNWEVKWALIVDNVLSNSGVLRIDAEGDFNCFNNLKKGASISAVICM